MCVKNSPVITIAACSSGPCENPRTCFQYLVSEPEKTFSEFSYFPNPADGELNIGLPKEDGKIIFVKLSNASGQDVNTDLILNKGNQININTKNLSEGFYILNIQTDTGKIMREKIIIEHK